MYHSDGTVPGAGAEYILRDQVPVHGEDLSHVLFPGLYREFIDTNVEELDGTITPSDQDLVLVRFGPGEIEEGILRVEPMGCCELRGR